MTHPEPPRGAPPTASAKADEPASAKRNAQARPRWLQLPLDPEHPPAWLARRVSVAYLLFGVSWIVISDVIVSEATPTSPAQFIADISKGLVFVGLTSVLLFVLVRHGATQLERSSRRAQTLRERALETERLRENGLLTARVAHDLRNYLTAAMGYVELGRVPGSDPDELKRAARALEDAADLTRQLSSLGHAATVPLEPTSVHEAFRTADGLTAPLLPSSVTLVVHPAAPSASVLAPSGQLVAALTNLILNSRDALPEGGTITVSHADVDVDLAAIIVRDDGAGMDDETLQRATDPFFTTKAHGKGTGLGLATVNAIARIAGGELLLTSSPGAGTTARLLLPSSPPVPPVTTR